MRTETVTCDRCHQPTADPYGWVRHAGATPTDYDLCEDCSGIIVGEIIWGLWGLEREARRS